MSDNRSTRAHIAASRGYLHEYLSTDALLTDETADALMRNVAGERAQFDTGEAHGPTSDPRGIDCGCGWGDLCDATRGYFTGRPYTLCGAQLERGSLAIARFRAPDPWSNDPDRTTRHWRPETAA